MCVILGTDFFFFPLGIVNLVFPCCGNASKHHQYVFECLMCLIHLILFSADPSQKKEHLTK